MFRRGYGNDTQIEAWLRPFDFETLGLCLGMTFGSIASDLQKGEHRSIPEIGRCFLLDGSVRRDI